MKERIKDEKKFEKQLNQTYDDALHNGKCIGALKVIDSFANRLNVRRETAMKIMQIPKDKCKMYLKAENDEESYSFTVNLSEMCRGRERARNTAEKETDIYSINRVITMLEIDADEAIELLDLPEKMYSEYPRSGIYDVCELLEEYGERDISMTEGEIQDNILETLKKHMGKLMVKRGISERESMEILNIPESYIDYFYSKEN